MKKQCSKITALILCAALVLGIAMPAYAANESNTQGVTFTAVLDTPELTVSEVDQTVTMTVKTNKSVDIDGIGLTFTSNDPTIKATAATGGPEVGEFATADYTPASGVVTWTYSYDEGDYVTVTSDLIIATYTIPAGTPKGEYILSAERIELTKDFGDVWESTATASATLTITDGSSTPAVGGYSANITVDPTEVVVGNTGTVKVNVTHNSDSVFGAGEVILTIPSNVTVAATGAVKNASGADVSYRINGTTLTIEDFGANKNLGNGVYVITYTAGNTAGEASFALSSAAFSDKNNAQKSDLINATADQTAKVVTIIYAPVNVSVDSSSTGYFKFESSAPYGKAYTFYKEEATGAYYNYSNVEYKVGNGAWTALAESNGSWTIPGSSVTGAITIRGTRAGITPTVHWEGEGAADITNKPTAQYGVDFVVTLPADKTPDTTPGYIYGISATMNGESIGSYDEATRKFTIPGTEITNDFTVTVTKTEQAENQFSVTISGSGDVVADKNIVNKGGEITLTLTREPGYTYVIKVNGEDKTSEFDSDNKYTIGNVQAAVSVEVTKTLDITNAKVTHYLQLDGNVMWLITIAPDANGTQLDGKLYTYNDSLMYWSDKYDAYCYLVISANRPVLTASNFSILNGTVTKVDYGMDVNDTGKVDANDAQLVYNMYQKDYADFSSDVAVEKFLRADVNGDALSDKTYDDAINVDDAIAVINAILNGTANNS